MNGIGNVYLTSNVNMYETLLCKLYNSFINTSIHLHVNGPVPLHMYLFTFRTKTVHRYFFFYIFKNDMNTSIQHTSLIHLILTT